MKFDSTYDDRQNKYAYFLFASIKQFDTHVYFDLYEHIILNDHLGFFDYNANPISKTLIKSDMVLPKVVFLYLVFKGVFLEKKGFVKSQDIRWFKGDIKKLCSPSKNYISGISKKKIQDVKTRYEIIFLVRAIDEDSIICDMRLTGCFNYNIGNFKIRKPLFEKIGFMTNAIINYSTIHSEIEYKISNLNYRITKPLFKKHYNDIYNCFEVLTRSPTNLTYSNLFKILAPTVEGLLIEFFHLKNISINTKNLGTMVNEMNKNTKHFTHELVELVGMILTPLRNFTLHGKTCSEKVAQFVVLVILDIYINLHDSIYKT